MTGGMDNPVDVVFTPGGERIFTTHLPPAPRRRPARRPDPRDLRRRLRQGPRRHRRATRGPAPTLMPVLTHLGPAAPCGLTRYESDAFGPEYHDNLFACQFNLHKVTRHVLDADGRDLHDAATRTSSSRDNLDFHPTDVLEDADGSLLVVDTGGWYKLCCPTSQLLKPDVLGGDLPRPPHGRRQGRRPARAEARLEAR